MSTNFIENGEIDPNEGMTHVVPGRKKKNTHCFRQGDVSTAKSVEGWPLIRAALDRSRRLVHSLWVGINFSCDSGHSGLLSWEHRVGKWWHEKEEKHHKLHEFTCRKNWHCYALTWHRLQKKASQNTDLRVTHGLLIPKRSSARIGWEAWLTATFMTIFSLHLSFLLTFLSFLPSVLFFLSIISL